MARPAPCADAHLEFLDALRLAGGHVWDAARDLAIEFFLGDEEAREIHRYWIVSFGARHP